MRNRLLLSFAIVTLVAIISMAGVMQISTAREVRAFMYGGGMMGLENIKNELEAYYRTIGSWQGVQLQRNMGHMGMRNGQPGQEFALYDSLGALVADTGGDRTSILGEAERAEAILLTVDGQTVGYLQAEGGIEFAPGQESQLLNRINNAALISGLIAGGVALILAFILSIGLTKPLKELGQAAQDLAQGNLSARVTARGPSELASLGQTFNQMALALQQAEEARRSLTADIAHELRTPLAIQQANLEALQDGIYPMTSESIQSILDQTRILTHLVNDLRTLALADAGELRLEMTATDLASLVENILARFQHQAAQQEVTLELHPVPRLPSLQLDPMRMEQVLTNLFSNALRYTPAGGRIECKLSTEYTPGNAPPSHSEVVMAIRDTGPGIPEEALPHIFERFYRADKGRARTEGGSGLGLAITRQLLSAQGGTIHAHNHPQGGAVFTVVLPVPER